MRRELCRCVTCADPRRLHPIKELEADPRLRKLVQIDLGWVRAESCGWGLVAGGPHEIDGRRYLVSRSKDLEYQKQDLLVTIAATVQKRSPNCLERSTLWC